MARANARAKFVAGREEQRPTGMGFIQHSLLEVLHGGTNPFCVYFRDWAATSLTNGKPGRQRSILPLAAVEAWDFGCDEGCGLATSTLLLLLNGCIAALNFLAADFSTVRAMGTYRGHTKAQRAVLKYLAGRVVRFLAEMHDHLEKDAQAPDAFAAFENKMSHGTSALQADKVDLPPVAATCDTQRHIPPELHSMVTAPDTLFPACCRGDTGEFSISSFRDRAEYLKLVWRQLQCGKLKLRRQVHACGDVFSVSKSGGRQREIWNGSIISAKAERPPPPLHLANPSCFVDLMFLPGQEVYMSKRDVHTCFDVLQAPEALQPWFGRPPVTCGELARVANVHVTAAQGFVVDNMEGPADRDEFVYPTSTVWPMGFSWSSCVAQAATVSCCMEAGVDEACFMTMDQPPAIGTETCGVATDDTFFFHTDKALGQRRLEQLDAVMAARSMPKNANKDVTLQPEMTALGCSVSSRSATVEPSSEKLLPLFLAWIDLLRKGAASPQGLNRALGLHQWFCLLQRPLFSVFDQVYNFVRQEPDSVRAPLPSMVCAEVAVASLLMPLLGADLSRRFLPLLTASDAAPEFGFGVVYKKCTVDQATSVGLLAERRGDYVKFYLDPEEPMPKDRLGTPHLLPFKKREFKVALSAKARWRAHSGSLEAHGLLLALKWLLRTSRRFHHRLVVLVDAKAVLGAASKGRTSAPGIRGIMRNIGALLLASNCLLRLVYVPTEYNPADAPSRGKQILHKKRVKKHVFAKSRSTMS